MDEHTPTNAAPSATAPEQPVTPAKFTMADAKQEAEKLPATTTTDGLPPTKEEVPATTQQDKQDEPPPFLQVETGDKDQEVDLDNIDYDAALEGVTDPKRRDDHRKGIEKIVNAAKAAREQYESALAQHEARFQPLDSYLVAFEDPAQWKAAYDYLGQQLSRMHGEFAPATPGATQTQTTTTQTQQTQSQGTDRDREAELWDKEHPSDLKARWTSDIAQSLLPSITDNVVSRVEAMLNERLGPVSEWHKQEQAKSQAQAQLDASYPSIHGRYPQATKEMVSQAISKFPTLEPVDAFRAAYADEIGRWGAEYAKRLSTAPAGPQITQANTQPSISGHERPNTMAGIRQELGQLQTIA